MELLQIDGLRQENQLGFGFQTTLVDIDDFDLIYDTYIHHFGRRF